MRGDIPFERTRDDNGVRTDLLTSDPSLLSDHNNPAHRDLTVERAIDADPPFSAELPLPGNAWTQNRIHALRRLPAHDWFLRRFSKHQPPPPGRETIPSAIMRVNPFV